MNKVIVAIMENWDAVEGSIESATNSTGSAERENAKYLNSINGKLSKLSSQFQIFSTDLINGGFFKFIIDLGTGFLHLVNTLNIVSIALGVFAVKLGALAFAKATAGAANYLTIMDRYQSALMLNSGSMANFAAHVKTGRVSLVGLSKQQLINIFTSEALGREVKLLNAAQIESQLVLMGVEAELAKKTAAEIVAKRSTIGHSGAIKVLTGALWTQTQALFANTIAFIKNHIALIAVIAVIVALVAIYKHVTEAQQRHIKAVEDSRQAYEDAKTELDSLSSKIEENNQKIQEANKLGNNKDYVTRLEAENKQLEIQKATQEALMASAKEKNAADARTLFTAKDYKKVVEDTQRNRSGMETGATWAREESADIVESTKSLLERAKAGEDVREELDKQISIITENIGALQDNNAEDVKLKNTLNGLLIEFTKLYPSIKSTSNALEGATKEASSLSDTLGKLSGIEESINSLSEVLGEFQEKGRITASTLVDLDKTFGDLNSFENFISTVSDSESKIGDVQNALTKLAEEYINASGIIKDFNSENVDLIETQLRSIGVENASEVANYRLGVAKAQAALQTLNLSEVSAESVNVLSQELQAMGLTEGAVSSLSNAFAKAQSAMLSAVQTGAAARLGILENELKQIKTMADAYAAIAKAGAASSKSMVENQRPKTVVKLPSAFKDSIIEKNLNKLALKDSTILAAAQKQYASDVQAIKDIAAAQEQLASLKINVKVGGGGVKIPSGGGGGGGSGGGGGGGGGGSTEDLWKKEFDDQYKLLQHQLNLNEITEQEYTDSLETLYKKYFANREEYLENFWQYEEEVYSKRKSLFEDEVEDIEHIISLLKKRGGTETEQINFYKQLQNKLHKQAEEYRKIGLDDNHEYIQELQEQWWSYSDEIKNVYKEIRDTAIESLEYQLKKQKEETDLYEQAISYATDLIDEQIEALKKQKEALQDKNNEEKRAIELQKLQDALHNARTQKNMRVFYADRGWVWEANQEAIKDAEQALKDFEFEEELRQIDERIEAWEEYKNQWNSVVSNYQKEQDRLMVLQKFGADFEQNVLSKRGQVIESFVKDYEEQMKRLELAQQMLNNAQETEATEEGITKKPPGYDKDTDYLALIQEGEKTGVPKEVLAGWEAARNEKIIDMGLSYPLTYKYTTRPSSASSGSGNKGNGSVGSSVGNTIGNTIGGIGGSVIGGIIGNSINSALNGIINSIKNSNSGGSSSGSGGSGGSSNKPSGGGSSGGGSSNRPSGGGSSGGGSSNRPSSKPPGTIIGDTVGGIMGGIGGSVVGGIIGNNINSALNGIINSNRHASGTTSAKGGPSLVDEVGEEMIVRNLGGRYTFLSKGDGVIPSNLTNNLMDWGKISPSNLIRAMSIPRTASSETNGNNGVVFQISQLVLNGVQSPQGLVDQLSLYAKNHSPRG